MSQKSLLKNESGLRVNWRQEHNWWGDKYLFAARWKKAVIKHFDGLFHCEIWCDGELLVNFIKKNLKDAQEKSEFAIFALETE